MALINHEICLKTTHKISRKKHFRKYPVNLPQINFPKPTRSNQYIPFVIRVVKLCYLIYGFNKYSLSCTCYESISGSTYCTHRLACYVSSPTTICLPVLVNLPPLLVITVASVTKQNMMKIKLRKK